MNDNQPDPAHREDHTGWIIFGVALIVVGVFMAASNLGIVPWPLGEVWRLAWQARVGVGVLLLGVLLIVWSQSSSRPVAPARGTRLYRSRSDKWLAGVLGGLARHFSVDPTFVRLAFLALVILFDVGGLVIAYIVMAIVVPLEPAEGVAHQSQAPPPAQWPSPPSAGGDAPPPAPPL